MERAHHLRVGRAARRRLTIAVLAALAVVGASCSADAEPAAEPSIRDTITNDGSDNDGSILQATVDGNPDDTEGAADEGDGADGTTPATDPPSSETEVTGPDLVGTCDADEATEITFEPGGTSAAINAAASSDQQDRYELEVGDGQIMTVLVTSEDRSARARVRAPNTANWSNDFSERVIAPTRAGFYEICVIAGRDGADYELFVSVIDDTTPNRIEASWCGSTVNDRGAIQFDIGAFGSAVEGGVLRDERDLYTIEASAGQGTNLALVSLEDNAVFDLRSPSGDLLDTEAFSVGGILPEDGVYQICVGSLRGNASYTLYVSIA